MNQGAATQNIFSMILSGGFVMYPLLICSIVSWVVIFERLWSYRRLGQGLRSFHLEALNALIRNDREAVKRVCVENSDLPTSRILMTALERLSSQDARIRERWMEAVERRRQLLNHDLRSYLWILGTIGSAAPFIGLFGTVVGVLESFHEMALKGSGGFAVVASGISEALIATAAGIVVAVIAVMAFNAFQTRWNTLVLMIRMHTEEFTEILSSLESGKP